MRVVKDIAMAAADLARGVIETDSAGYGFKTLMHEDLPITVVVAFGGPAKRLEDLMELSIVADGEVET